jgi:hypothetical protein
VNKNALHEGIPEIESDDLTGPDVAVDYEEDDDAIYI